MTPNIAGNVQEELVVGIESAGHLSSSPSHWTLAADPPLVQAHDELGCGLLVVLHAPGVLVLLHP